ncbi:MAG: ATP synthase F1 subunit delta [Planctomycetes bacterium GWF2_50_10]|nr:MAG: ATP synthase F1 subunit delta [Planctomycetes bacterium GWF2_50_10]
MNSEAATRLGNIYARALFELALEGKVVDGVRNDLGMLSELSSQEDQFGLLNGSPYFTPEFKSKVLRKMLAGRVTELTLDFLMIAAKRGRLAFLPQMTESYETLWEEHNGIMPVRITLATDPATAEVEELKAQIGEAIGKKVKLQVGVNADILGGIVIRCKDMVIDNSVRGAFTRAVKTIIDRKGKAQIQ